MRMGTVSSMEKHRPECRVSADLQLISCVHLAFPFVDGYYAATTRNSFVDVIGGFPEEIAIFTTERQSRRCVLWGPQYVPDDKGRIQRQSRDEYEFGETVHSRDGDDSGIPPMTLKSLSMTLRIP
jgi:hypothetical protein